MSIFDGKKLASTYSRAKLVSLFTTICSLSYHVGVFVLFFFLKIYPMFFFNIFSISVFTFLLLKIPKLTSFVGHYMLASFEVVTHQILADYFLGSTCGFHFFILLIGLLPFLVFEDRYSLTTPITTVTALFFIVLENINLLPKYDVSPVIITAIKYINVGLTIFILMFMILIFTLIVYRTEARLQNQKDRLEKEIKMASVIQQNFFKQKNGKTDGWDLAYYNRPMAGVSGDLYDVYCTENKLDGLGIFDVSGHGISSGLVTMLVKNIIHQEFYNDEAQDLWEILNTINDRVIEEKGDIENYMTGILLRVLDKNKEGKSQIEFVNAGHPIPILYRNSTKEFVYLQKPGKSLGVIGLDGVPTYFISQYETMESGDELILYTDGIEDVQNANKVEYGKVRFIDSLNRNINLPANAQIHNVIEEINDFSKNASPNDDITLIILKKE